MTTAEPGRTRHTEFAAILLAPEGTAPGYAGHKADHLARLRKIEGTLRAVRHERPNRAETTVVH